MGQAKQIIPLNRGRTKSRLQALRSGGRVDPEAVEFQPDALMIEARPLPWIARSVVYIVVLFVVCAVVWATVSQMDRVVTARGKLITIDPLMIVQPLETAVIRTIDAGVGDFVTAGAVLATLDPTFTESEQIADRERLASMMAEPSGWRRKSMEGRFRRCR